MQELGPAAGSGVRFTILGPLRAWRDTTELDLGPRQMRLMLALLLVRAGGVVSSADVQLLLWGSEPPAGAANIVHRHVGALRRLIEPGVPPRASGRWLVRHSGGYRLVVDERSVDLLRFRAHASAGRRAAESGDHASALAEFLAALRTWSGPCAAGLDLNPSVVPEFVALNHERAAVACAAADAAMLQGQVAELVPMIRPIAELNLFNEALQARLLLTLAADGKQAEAVAVYEKLRLGLSDHLGVRPGAELRTAYDRVLKQQDASGSARLPIPAQRRPTPAPSSPVDRLVRKPPAQLPLSTRFFSGRDRELGWLLDLPRTGGAPAAPIVVAVDGLPGVGKTSLVVHWAHLVAEGFPDGQLFVDLQGYDAKDAVSPGQVLMQFLIALGRPPSEIPATTEAQASVFRTLTAARKLLVILDNARDAEQIRPLLPTGPGCVAVVTSRNQLTGLVAQQGAYRLTLDLPSLEDSRAVLRARLGDGRVADDSRALDEIIKGCGHLPLAMAVVAARAAAYPDWGLQEIALELRAARSLAVFDDDDPRTDVRSVFSWSYRQLSEPAKSLFRLLALHPGPDFGPAAAAGLAGVSPAVAEALIGELTRTRLLTRHRPRRYRFHDLIHLYAVELGGTADGPGERHAALARLLDHLRQTAYEAGARLMTQIQFKPPPPLAGVTPERIADVAEAMDWFTAEQAVLEAAIMNAPLPGFATWHLVEGLVPFYMRLGMFRSLETAAEAALHAADGRADREGMARMHRLIGGATLCHGDCTPAVEHFERARVIFSELGMPMEAAYVDCNLGWARYKQEATDDSLRHYRRAHDYFVTARNRRGEADSLLGIGHNLTRAGRVEAAITSIRKAAPIFDEIGDLHAAGDCASAESEALDLLGRKAEAIECRLRARYLFRKTQNDWESARNEAALGDLYLSAGRREEAIRCWREAILVYRALGFADQEDVVLERLSRVGEQTPVG